MKQLVFLVILVIYSLAAFGQDGQENTAFNKYKFRYDQKAHYEVKIKKDTLKKGWIISEKIGGVEIRRTLKDTMIVTSKIDTVITFKKNWKINEVKHTNDKPGKLIVNPYDFIFRKDLNHKFYVKIPENGSVILKRTYVKWSAITIPFALRPALNDTIGSKVTTDLKIGASISFNRNKEKYKNRRIAAKKSVYGISAGLGFGFSKVTLNKNSTSLLEKPYENEEDGLAFFFAPGIGINLKGFQVAGFVGWDIGLTDNVSDWNYNNKNYFGIGLGINLSTIGKG